MTKIEVVSKKLIKPSIPTPQSLKNYKLSFLDETSQRMAIGVLLFYGKFKKNHGRLEASLAKTLVQFYPFAGRYNRRHRYMDCSDQGVGFVEAEALDVELDDVVFERNLEKLSCFFPYMNNQLIDDSIDPILSIQTTELKSSGLVVGISVSHRVFDASSLGTFIEAWSSNSCRNSSCIEPIFDCWKFFPSKNQINNDSDDVDGFETPNLVVKMFPFKNDAITSLKSKLGVSRVRVVSAIIFKAFIELCRAKQGGEFKPFLAMQALNIRGRTMPPLPKHSCGNLSLTSPKEFTIETREIEIKEVMDHLGDGLKKSFIDCTDILSMDENKLCDIIVKPVVEAFQRMLSGKTNMLGFSDWSKFGFYESDFGWGKPVWTSIVACPIRNGVVLMDNKEGNGIEAWVHLDKIDMSLFEQNEGIRSLN